MISTSLPLGEVPGEHDTGSRERVAVVVVELEAVAVALVHHGLAVGLGGASSRA